MRSGAFQHRLDRYLGVFLCLSLFGAFSAFADGQTSAKASPGVNRDGLIVGQFQKRVDDYLKIRKQAKGEAPAPKQSDAAEKIVESQHELAGKIRELRPDAKQGDIFTPEVADLFRRLISQSLHGKDGKKIRKSYQHAEPIHGVRLDVNQAYPDRLPLQSMPPSLLQNLPKLPPELEYRLVGRELVLRDVAANLIVDVISDIGLSPSASNSKKKTKA